MRSPKRYLLVGLVLLSLLTVLYRIIASKRIVQVGDISYNFPHEESEAFAATDHDQISVKNLALKSINQIREHLLSNPDVTGPEGNLKSAQHLLEYINDPAAVVPFDFNDCRMSNCFDFSRCQGHEPLKVHIVPKSKLSDTNTTMGESNLIHRNILRIIRESDHFEPEADKACIFVLEDDTLDRDPLSQSFRPYQSELFDQGKLYGMNHLVFNLYSGSWPYYRENDFSGLQFRAAILAKASNSIKHHRQQFDISLPLFSYQHPISKSVHHSQDEPRTSQIMSNRTYFLTFKGKRYVYGSGSDTRNNLYHLDNQRDIIMLTTCRHGKRWRQSSDMRCSEDESNYDKHDFVDLMRESTFCLTPRGRRLGSFRFLEALSHGCIPVVLSDGWVEPFSEIIDWSCATVQFDESLLLQAPDLLRDVTSQTIVSMRQNCLNLYERYFSTTQKIILTTLSILDRRIKNHIRQG